MTTTRFAPSPTGYIHIGNLRSALFNYLIARKAGGTFILRLDDTDQERSKQEYADGIMEDLEWLGLTWDRVERQSARLDRYAEEAQRLREMGRFYECFETPVELDLKRKKQLNMGKPPVYDRAALALSEAEKDALRAEREGYWRFRLDQQRIEWTDGILGPISIDAASVSDPVLIRADGQVLYTLASVVDDVEMGVTDIVRGSDHVTNTATQIQIIEALGAKPPAFGHHSLLTGPQGEALSKRLGTLSIRDLRAKGIAPEALLSLMARLGSSQPVELRMSLDEIAEGFDLSQFGAAPTKFDEDDLLPLTQKRNQGLPFDAVRDRIAGLGVPDDMAERFWRVASHNITVLGDLDGWWALCRDGAEPVIEDEDREFVAQAMAMLPPLPFTDATWGEWTGAVKEATGPQGQGAVHAAAQGADRTAARAGDGGPDAAVAGGARQELRSGPRSAAGGRPPDPRVDASCLQTTFRGGSALRQASPDDRRPVRPHRGSAADGADSAVLRGRSGSGPASRASSRRSAQPPPPRIHAGNPAPPCRCSSAGPGGLRWARDAGLRRRRPAPNAPNARRGAGFRGPDGCGHRHVRADPAPPSRRPARRPPGRRFRYPRKAPPTGRPPGASWYAARPAAIPQAARASRARSHAWPG